jgi:hypothetical protein
MNRITHANYYRIMKPTIYRLKDFEIIVKGCAGYVDRGNPPVLYSKNNPIKFFNTKSTFSIMDFLHAN